jgi:hypothetical protein
MFLCHDIDQDPDTQGAARMREINQLTTLTITQGSRQGQGGKLFKGFTRVSGTLYNIELDPSNFLYSLTDRLKEGGFDDLLSGVKNFQVIQRQSPSLEVHNEVNEEKDHAQCHASSEDKGVYAKVLEEAVPQEEVQDRTGQAWYAKYRVSSLSLGGGLVPSLCRVLDIVGSVWTEYTHTFCPCSIYRAYPSDPSNVSDMNLYLVSPGIECVAPSSRSDLSKGSLLSGLFQLRGNDTR